jgi:hypothetical protein
LGLPSLYFLKQVLGASETRDGGKALDLVRKELKRADGLDFDERAAEDRNRLLAHGTLGEYGTNQHSGPSNIRATKDYGTTAAYTAARLARDRPDLSARTILPKSNPQHLSIHAAAIEAGFRTKTLSIPADLPGAARAIVRHFGAQTALQLNEAVIDEVRKHIAELEQRADHFKRKALGRQH